jgi:hypothetical protein
MNFSISSNVVPTGDRKQYGLSNGSIMQSASSVEREYMGGIENFVFYVVRVAKRWRYKEEMYEYSPMCREKL